MASSSNKIDKTVAEPLVRMAKSSILSARDRIKAIVHETGESDYLHGALASTADAMEALDEWARSRDVEIRNTMQT